MDLEDQFPALTLAKSIASATAALVSLVAGWMHWSTARAVSKLVSGDDAWPPLAAALLRLPSAYWVTILLCLLAVAAVLKNRWFDIRRAAMLDGGVVLVASILLFLSWNQATMLVENAR